MTNFNLIDFDNWNRKEHFNHYMNQVRCSYSVTVNIDVTQWRKVLKAAGLKDYPAQIYLLSSVVNEFPEFRMSLDGEGNLGYWDSVSPLYTALNKETETFSSIWTDYDSSFESFYQRCVDDTDTFCNGALFPKPDCPANVFTISSVPWLDFTALDINVFNNGTYLAPIFTIGKYIEVDGKVMMPLAIQVHHAVCDGLHVGRFVERVREMATRLV